MTLLDWLTYWALANIAFVLWRSIRGWQRSGK